MRESLTNGDAQALALRALAWTLADGPRADRLLALTGLDAAALRARIGEPAVLAATLGFLESHEADLVACAEAIGTNPAALVAAREELDRLPALSSSPIATRCCCTWCAISAPGSTSPRRSTS